MDQQAYELQADDRFSWSRVAMIFRYYYPQLRIQFIVYPLISLIAGIATILSDYHTLIILFAGLLGTIQSFMFCWSPCALTRSPRDLEVGLPALESEKATFILLYFLVGIPLLTYLPQWILLWIFGNPLMVMSSNMFGAGELSVNFLTIFSSLVESYVPLVTCLFVVLVARKSRVLKGVLWSVVSLVMIGMCSAVFGIVYAVNNIDMAGDSIDGSFVGGMVNNLVLIIGTISLVYSVVMIYLSYRAIRNTQV